MNKQKNQFTFIISNFSGVTKELQFNLKDLATSFKATLKIYEIATDKMTDFNSPVHKDSISLKEREAQVKGINQCEIYSLRNNQVLNLC